MRFLLSSLYNTKIYKKNNSSSSSNAFKKCERKGGIKKKNGFNKLKKNKNSNTKVSSFSPFFCFHYTFSIVLSMKMILEDEK